jgi:tight adherence protein C
MVNRKVNAGMPREQALQGLWTRTGLDELRGLVASMVQSERWGTSIAKVLRVNAETLRRVRKQAAEKKAAQASLKMMGPMVIFMLRRSYRAAWPRHDADICHPRAFGP